jgi:serine/threonine protein kinase
MTKTNQKKINKVKKEIGTGIKSLNKYGIIHRDVKPQNIFIREDGTYVLCLLLIYILFIIHYIIVIHNLLFIIHYIIIIHIIII